MNTCEIRRHYFNYYILHVAKITHINLSFILESQRPFQMARHKNNKLDANEDFVMFLTSKLITCSLPQSPPLGNPIDLLILHGDLPLG